MLMHFQWFADIVIVWEGWSKSREESEPKNESKLSDSKDQAVKKEEPKFVWETIKWSTLMNEKMTKQYSFLYYSY